MLKHTHTHIYIYKYLRTCQKVLPNSHSYVRATEVSRTFHAATVLTADLSSMRRICGGDVQYIYECLGQLMMQDDNH